MNPFIKKVVAVAVVVAVAGVAGASHARADSSLSTHGSWFDTYADDAIANKYSGSNTTIIILKTKKKPKHKYRHFDNKHHHKSTEGRYIIRRDKHRSNSINRTHSSGYRW